MNNIDWEALKASVQIEEPKTKANEEVEVEYEGIEYFPKRDEYAQIKVLLAYYKAYKKLEYKNDSIKNIYDSIFDILMQRKTKVGNVLMEDLKELDKCYESGAYKATLILAGSILEAVLLDWLSENDGKDYFSVPYQVIVTQKDGTQKWVQKEELRTYIDKIDEIERPHWMQADNAHTIRRQRNLVHAKLQLKSELGVDEKTCIDVIEYLKEIIETRLNKMQKDLID